jgi:fibronectin-binding autotransporter adhesin
MAGLAVHLGNLGNMSTTRATMRFIASAALAALLAASAADAANISYAINHAVTGPNLSGGVGTGSVVGQLVTDGTNGTLAQANIVSWSFLLTGQKGATYSISSATASTYIFGSGLSATSTRLLFNFSDKGGAIALFQQGLFSGNHYYCLAASGGACAQGESVVPTANTAADAIYSPMTGVVGIAGPAGPGPGLGQISPNPNPSGNTVTVTGNGNTNDQNYTNNGNLNDNGGLTNNLIGTLNNNGNLNINTNGLFSNLGTTNNGGSGLGGLITNLGTLTNGIAGNIINNSGATFDNGGIASNLGSILNGVGGTFTNEQAAALSNAGGTLSNLGILTNTGTISTGASSGGSGGVFSNLGSLANPATGNILTSIGGTFDNGGIASNLGSILNGVGGTFTNEQAAALSNAGGTLSNLGILTNTGTISTGASSGGSHGLFSNLGSLANTATGNILNSIGGTFDNGGSTTNIGSILNGVGGTLTNEQTGTLSNLGGLITNLGNFASSGFMTNAPSGGLGGVINNMAGAVANIAAGVVTNSGIINNNGGTLSETLGAVINGTGTYNQTGGTTTINGTFSQGIINIAGGILGGSGLINGAVNVGGGEVSPGNSPGTLTINGNLAMTAASSYLWQVDFGATPTASDKLVVSGTAAANGTVIVQVLNGAAVKPGTATYAILTAAGGLTAKNFVLSAPASAVESFTLSYPNANTVQIATSVDFVQPGLSGNDSAVGAAIDGIQLVGVPSFQPITAALVALPTLSALSAAYDTLSGEVHPTVAATLLNDSRFMADAVQSRSRSDDGMSVWGHEDYRRSDFGGNANAAAADGHLLGFSAGIDTVALPNLRLGAAFGYSRGDLNITARTSTANVNSTYLGGYADFNAGAFSFAGVVSYAWHNIGTWRGVALGGASQAETANYDGNTTDIFGEVRYHADLGGFFAEPFANISVGRLETDGFAESGGLTALTGKSADRSIIYTTLGASFGKVYALEDGTLSPHFSLGWEHAAGALVPQEALAFASGGPGFAVAGVPLSRDALATQAGIDLGLGSVGVSLYYGGRLGGNVTQHSVNFSLKVSL